MDNESSKWFCPNCGALCDGKFCTSCGAKRPEPVQQSYTPAEPAQPYYTEPVQQTYVPNGYQATDYTQSSYQAPNYAQNSYQPQDLGQNNYQADGYSYNPQPQPPQPPKKKKWLPWVIVAAVLVIAIAAIALFGGSKKTDPGPVSVPSVSSPSSSSSSSSTTTQPATTQPATTNPAPATSDIEGLDWWDGYWYGFWMASDRTGDYADWAVDWWDVCAEIETYPDGTAYITLWDEDTSYESPMAMAYVELFETEKADHGYAVVSDDYYGYLYNIDLKDEEWTIDPSVAKYDEMFYITGDYKDSNGSFSYAFILRPWGTLWDDIQPDDADFYNTFFYDNWYLPMLASGATQPPLDDVTLYDTASNYGG